MTALHVLYVVLALGTGVVILAVGVALGTAWSGRNVASSCKVREECEAGHMMDARKLRQRWEAAKTAMLRRCMETHDKLFLTEVQMGADKIKAVLQGLGPDVAAEWWVPGRIADPCRPGQDAAPKEKQHEACTALIDLANEDLKLFDEWAETVKQARIVLWYGLNDALTPLEVLLPAEPPFVVPTPKEDMPEHIRKNFFAHGGMPQ